MASASPEPASFRDPDSAVFYSEGLVLRGLSERGATAWRQLAQTSFFRRLVDEGRIVRTAPREGEAPPGPRGEPWSLVLEHERIPVVSYPFEWPFAMLREAAVCHLEVVLAALDEGVTTKDGTAYNVQFIGSRPVFIDLGSFEAVNGPWAGYRQFCQTFLFPLLVQAHLRIAYQGLLRGSVDGLQPADVRGMFGGLRRFKRGVFRHVYLHSVAERRVTGSSESVKAELGRAGFGTELAKATVAKTLKLVRRLEVKRSGTAWSDYRDSCSYTDEDACAKRAFVEAALAAGPARCVLDLGANDGAYSLLAAGHAELVVAVDGDEAVIDGLYRRLRREGVANVLPLVMNLADPSPGIGWRNKERSPFAARVRPDVVLSLALVHHLAITVNVPIPEIVDWLHGFGARLVVEFVDRADP
ncbi:MAG: class I SAM-dependent methyltransferase, partial [Actinomycetota bacterium]|nr:class I SAM-dependent methyltransferase [Actinomycetota bacterium]